MQCSTLDDILHNRFTSLSDAGHALHYIMPLFVTVLAGRLRYYQSFHSFHDAFVCESPDNRKDPNKEPKAFGVTQEYKRNMSCPDFPLV